MPHTTLTIPDDIEVGVDYDVNEFNEPELDTVYIGNKKLNTDRLYIKRDSGDIVSLGYYLQQKLDEELRP